MNAFTKYDHHTAEFLLPVDVPTDFLAWQDTAVSLPLFKKKFFIRLDGAIRECRITALTFVGDGEKNSVSREGFILDLEIAGKTIPLAFCGRSNHDVDFLYNTPDEAMEWAQVCATWWQEGSVDLFNELTRNALKKSFTFLPAQEPLSILGRYMMDNMVIRTVGCSLKYLTVVPSEGEAAKNNPGGVSYLVIPPEGNDTFASKAELLKNKMPKIILL